jgi:hypothetical protein
MRGNFEPDICHIERRLGLSRAAAKAWKTEALPALVRFPTVETKIERQAPTKNANAFQELFAVGRFSVRRCGP